MKGVCHIYACLNAPEWILIWLAFVTDFAHFPSTTDWAAFTAIFSYCENISPTSQTVFCCCFWGKVILSLLVPAENSIVVWRGRHLTAWESQALLGKCAWWTYWWCAAHSSSPCLFHFEKKKSKYFKHFKFLFLNVVSVAFQQECSSSVVDTLSQRQILKQQQTHPAGLLSPPQYVPTVLWTFFLL